MNADELKLAKAKKAYEHSKQKEEEARAALRLAEDVRRITKEKYEQAFFESEEAEVKRRLASYNHATK